MKTKFKNIKDEWTDIKDGVAIILTVNDKASIRDVEDAIQMFASGILYFEDNLNIEIDEKKKQIILSSKTEGRFDKSCFDNFTTVQNIDILNIVTERLKNLFKENPKFKDEKMGISFIHASHLAKGLTEYFTKFDVTELQFCLYPDKDKMDIGLNQKIDDDDMLKLRNTMEYYKGNVEGLFWKKEWIKRKDTDVVTKTGRVSK